jgi:hypothetical protein
MGTARSSNKLRGRTRRIRGRNRVTGGTANKLVALFAIGGVAFELWTAKDAPSRYRRVWGVTVLSIAGAVLADFAPAIVGPFFAVVIVAAIAGRSTEIGGIASGIKNRAGVK